MYNAIHFDALKPEIADKQVAGGGGGDADDNDNDNDNDNDDSNNDDDFLFSAVVDDTRRLS